MTDQIEGAPSVLFDAVTILPGKDSLASNSAAVDFVNDAFAHCKYIAWAAEASEFMDACGLDDFDDAALCKLIEPAAIARFVTACRALRYWPREAAFDA